MGWDVDRFPGEVDLELICCICTGVLEDPVESPCRHVFCSPCVKPWINKNSTCPQCRSSIYEKDLKPVVPILKNIIDKQKIWCNYKENGCEEVVTIEALQRHLEKCSFEPSRAQIEKNSRQNIAQESHSKVENKSLDQGTSVRPWYVRDEDAEVTFLRRHKNFLSEIKYYSASKWPRRRASDDFESERDAKLCLSRNSKQLDFFSKCDGCRRNIIGTKYRCLECKDMDLCRNCHQRKTVPLGHASSHKMAELRFICDGCGSYIIKTQLRCTECYDFDLCLDCHQRKVFPKRHHVSHKMIKKNLLTDETLSASGPGQSTQSLNSDIDEEKEIVLCKRHKKHFEEVQKVTARVWGRTCQNKSLEFIRDMKLFMSRYSVNSEFVTKCNGCATCLPWQKYRCLDCFDTDLCARCYLSLKQPNGHLSTHKMVELRVKCDGCQALIIQTRYKCNVCTNVDFCADCHKNGNFPTRHTRNHSVTRSLLNEDFPYDLFDV